MAKKNSVLPALLASPKADQVRADYHAMTLRDFCDKWNCGRYEPSVYIGQSMRPTNRGHRASSLLSRIHRGELDFEKLRREWHACENMVVFAEKYRTTTHTAARIFGEHGTLLETTAMGKIVAMNKERERAVARWEDKQRECARLARENAAAVGRYEGSGASAVAPILSPNLRICR